MQRTATRRAGALTGWLQRLPASVLGLDAAAETRWSGVGRSEKILSGVGRVYRVVRGWTSEVGLSSGVGLSSDIGTGLEKLSSGVGRCGNFGAQRGPPWGGGRWCFRQGLDVRGRQVLDFREGLVHGVVSPERPGGGSSLGLEELWSGVGRCGGGALVRGWKIGEDFVRGWT